MSLPKPPFFWFRVLATLKNIEGHVNRLANDTAARRAMEQRDLNRRLGITDAVRPTEFGVLDESLVMSDIQRARHEAGLPDDEEEEF